MALTGLYTVRTGFASFDKRGFGVFRCSGESSEERADVCGVSRKEEDHQPRATRVGNEREVKLTKSSRSLCGASTLIDVRRKPRSVGSFRIGSRGVGEVVSQRATGCAGQDGWVQVPANTDARWIMDQVGTGCGFGCRNLLRGVPSIREEPGRPRDCTLSD